MKNETLLLLGGAVALFAYLFAKEDKPKKMKKTVQKSVSQTEKAEIFENEQDKLNMSSKKDVDLERQPNIGPVINGQAPPSITETGL